MFINLFINFLFIINSRHKAHEIKYKNKMQKKLVHTTQKKLKQQVMPPTIKWWNSIHTSKHNAVCTRTFSDHLSEQYREYTSLEIWHYNNIGFIVHCHDEVACNIYVVTLHSQKHKLMFIECHMSCFFICIWWFDVVVFVN